MKIPQDVPWRSNGTTLGSGGQGEVQIVTRKDETDGEKYALKILRNVGSEQARLRFRREIEAINEVKSDHIVKVIDHSNEDDEFQFYVMEYHEGAKTLDSIMLSPDNPYHGNITKSLDLFEQVITAIQDCRTPDTQIVHRDINPKNILVLEDGTIRLIDFGICQFQDGAMITLVDENVGARNYTSPECEAGNNDAIGVASDIYSAAKVLWSAMTSKQAFAREEPVFKDRSMQRMFPTDTETWHLSRIFEKTIRHDPSDRFQLTSQIIPLISDVRYVVKRSFPPLEIAVYRCPSCGFNDLGFFENGHAVFGDHNLHGVKAIICNTCGFAFVRNVEIWRSNVERLNNLN